MIKNFPLLCAILFLLSSCKPNLCREIEQNPPVISGPATVHVGDTLFLSVPKISGADYEWETPNPGNEPLYWYYSADTLAVPIVNGYDQGIYSFKYSAGDCIFEKTEFNVTVDVPPLPCTLIKNTLSFEDSLYPTMNFTLVDHTVLYDHYHIFGDNGGNGAISIFFYPTVPPPTGIYKIVSDFPTEENEVYVDVYNNSDVFTNDNDEYLNVTNSGGLLKIEFCNADFDGSFGDTYHISASIAEF